MRFVLAAVVRQLLLPLRISRHEKQLCIDTRGEAHTVTKVVAVCSGPERCLRANKDSNVRQEKQQIKCQTTKQAEKTKNAPPRAQHAQSQAHTRRMRIPTQPTSSKTKTNLANMCTILRCEVLPSDVSAHSVAFVEVQASGVVVLSIK